MPEFLLFLKLWTHVTDYVHGVLAPVKPIVSSQKNLRQDSTIY